MGVVVRVTQRSVPLVADVLRDKLSAMLVVAGAKDWDVGLWVTNDATIRRLNREYRGISRATDILSFPFYTGEELKAPGVLPTPSDDELRNLGDMVLSAPYVARQCRREGWRLERRMDVLLAHGVCHLMGYTHDDDDDFAEMSAREEELLREHVNFLDVDGESSL